jgi:putative FmdB family regulatory protein
LYEYLCRGCGRRFEAMRRMSERLDAPACPECGSEQTGLELSASAFLGGAAGSGAGGACSTGTWTGGG